VTGSLADVLTLEARARLARTISRAEAGTSGEIVVMVSRRAGAYRSIVLLVTLAAALILPWPLIALTTWSATSILLAQAALSAVILVASQNERLRLALVPRSLRSARAREAGQRAFWSRGLSLTQGRTGVLLYLSLAERHAEIVTDLGVLRRIPPTAWDEILADLVQALGRGTIEAGLTMAVERVGAYLAEHLPASADNPDELPNRVIVVD
jgi:putative membrane protein